MLYESIGLSDKIMNMIKEIERRDEDVSYKTAGRPMKVLLNLWILNNLKLSQNIILSNIKTPPRRIKEGFLLICKKITSSSASLTMSGHQNQRRQSAHS